MKKMGQKVRPTTFSALACLSAAIVVLALTLKLDNLLPGLAPSEVLSATSRYGFHAILHNPFYLPYELVRRITFALLSPKNFIAIRLPSVILGVFTIVCFSYLAHLWHGRKTALAAGLLFGLSAWTLHVSRLGAVEATYLLAFPLLLLIQAGLPRYGHKLTFWYGSLLAFGFLSFVPGLIWIILLQFALSAKIFKLIWHKLNLLNKLLSGVLILSAWVPIIYYVIKHHEIKLWLGLPVHWPAITRLGREFFSVLINLTVRGPSQSELWLGRAPLLDIFALVLVLIGTYFYASHPRAARSRNLFFSSLIGLILVVFGRFGGGVGFSLLVPIVYLLAATGFAYLLQAWLKTFPHNPLARSLGLVLLSAAVIASCSYNLRSYFIAWPHNQMARQTFSQQLK